MRVLLEHKGDIIELLPGETTIGRDMACKIRFNDAAISRRHLRILVTDDSVMVEDLGSSNGTRINGVTVLTRARVSDGDTIEIGARVVRVRVLKHDAARVPYEEDPDTENLPVIVPARPDVQASALVTASSEIPAPRMDLRTCPFCRASVPVGDDRCRDCKSLLPSSRAVAVTQAHKLPEFLAAETKKAVTAERRREARHAVQLPVVYASDDLTFEGMALDLNRTGMFIETDLLEPVGTECTVTILADGAPAITIAAVVSRVVEGAQDKGTPAGLGLMITSMGPDAEAWLNRVVDRSDAAAQHQSPAVNNSTAK